MKSIKPGRGPSRRGAAGAVFQIIWGIIWTVLVCVIMVPVAGAMITQTSAVQMMPQMI